MQKPPVLIIDPDLALQERLGAALAEKLAHALKGAAGSIFRVRMTWKLSPMRPLLTATSTLLCMKFG